MIDTDLAASTVDLHPLPVKLAEFGLGKLDEVDSARISEHISACETCRILVAAVADDSLAGLFRRAIDREAVWNDQKGPAMDDAVLAGSPSGYEILEVLGQGGMGLVSKARQIGLGRFVALKQLRPDVFVGRDGVSRFRREAEAVARLRHPNIVPIYDVGWRGDLPYFSMEYVEGGTLSQRLTTSSIDPRTAARLVETLSRAVQHAHDSGVVHRDLKPSNILLAPDLDHPKISDFGLAKLDNDGNRTGSGAILGTPNYMAPEQAIGDSSKVGPSADIYALGAVLYEALTGHPPFQGETILEILEMVRSSDPSSPRQFRGEIPRDLETITLKCLEKDPQRRYLSARALADDLRRHLDGQPITARPVSTLERLAKWARRRPWQAISLALGVILMLGAFAGTLIHNARLRDEVARTEKEAREARTQRTRAETQYRAARTAIRQMLARLEDPRFSVPDRLGFRRKQLEDALTFYDGAIQDDATADLSARIDRIDAIMEAGQFQIMIERADDAIRSYRRALGLLRALEQERNADLEILGRLINCLEKLGLSLSAARRFDESVTFLLEAIERAERAEPDGRKRGDELSWCHHNLGATLLRIGQADEAEIHFNRSVALRRDSLGSQGENLDIQARLAESLINLALIHSSKGKIDQADAEYDEAAGHLEPICQNHPDRHSTVLALVALELNRGNHLLMTSRTNQALDRFRAGQVSAGVVLREIPEWPEARQLASNLAGAIAYALILQGLHPEAIASWDRAIELSEGETRKTFRVNRLASLAHEGRGSEVLREARSMAEELPPLTGLDFYNLACVAAIASGVAEAADDSSLRESAARSAIGWLEQALAKGLFRNDPRMIGALQNDDDLKSLRPREDFRQFYRDLAFPPDPFRTGR